MSIAPSARPRAQCLPTPLWQKRSPRKIAPRAMSMLQSRPGRDMCAGLHASVASTGSREVGGESSEDASSDEHDTLGDVVALRRSPRKSPRKVHMDAVVPKTPPRARKTLQMDTEPEPAPPVRSIFEGRPLQCDPTMTPADYGVVDHLSWRARSAARKARPAPAATATSLAPFLHMPPLDLTVRQRLVFHSDAPFAWAAAAKSAGATADQAAGSALNGRRCGSRCVCVCAATECGAAWQHIGLPPRHHVFPAPRRRAARGSQLPQRIILKHRRA